MPRSGGGRGSAVTGQCHESASWGRAVWYIGAEGKGRGTVGARKGWARTSSSSTCAMISKTISGRASNGGLRQRARYGEQSSGRPKMTSMSWPKEGRDEKTEVDVGVVGCSFSFPSWYKAEGVR